MKNFEIMVVDDDPAILKLIDSALSTMGYRVTKISDPQRALKLLAEKRFDLIVTDLQMEPVDGFQVLATSKKLHPKVPVIVLTGHAESHMAVKALKLNADDYLFKPVQLQNLYYSISACLEKTKLEEAVDRNRRDLELFKAVTDFSNEAVAVWDLEGKLIYANPAYQSLFGCQCGKDNTLDFNTFLTKKSKEIMRSEILPALKRGEGWEGVLNSIDSKNRQFPLWKRVDAIRDETGRMLHIFGFMHDFTKEMKNAESLLKKQKTEALGTLAGGIAHEFNNIFWIIGANAELLSSHIEADSQGRKNLDRLQEACDRAVDLVNQILNFSRQNEYEPKKLEIVPLVKESLKLFKASTPSIIEIREKISRDCGIIIFEPSLMHQILLNLYTNAAQAMEENGGVLEVEMKKVSLNEETAFLHDGLAPGAYIKLSVVDTGAGIPLEVQERIFDPFFTTRDTGDGRGMGLAVVQGAVKNHGGTVEVHSEPGKGTRFDLYFPRVQKRKRTPSDFSETPMGDGARILLVDDDDLVVQSEQAILESLGYRVITLDNGDDALQMFRRDPHEFDLVITDMSMPQMTGLMLAEAILKIRKDIPVIIFSGYSDMVDEKKAFDIGIKGLMIKPITPKAMAEAIKKVLGQG